MRSTLPALAEELQTTDRTLRRAVSQGLVRAERPSPRTLRLPVAERVYLRAGWPLLSALRAALRTEPGVRLAVLFGSRARGDHRPDSDVDLVAALADPLREHELRQRLETALGLRVQLVRFDDAMRAPLLIEQVVLEGRVLVDREELWPSLTRRRAAIHRAAARELRRIDDQFEAAFGQA